MNFNSSMASMAAIGLVLLVIGWCRNITPPIPSRTRWGWFVLACPFYCIPVGVAIYRLI
jgi:hypothetical protein